MCKNTHCKRINKCVQNYTVVPSAINMKKIPLAWMLLHSRRDWCDWQLWGMCLTHNAVERSCIIVDNGTNHLVELLIWRITSIGQGVTKTYKWWDERQKINYEANNDRNLTKLTTHCLDLYQIEVWPFFLPHLPPIMVITAHIYWKWGGFLVRSEE